MPRSRWFDLIWSDLIWFGDLTDLGICDFTGRYATTLGKGPKYWAQARAQGQNARGPPPPAWSTGPMGPCAHFGPGSRLGSNIWAHGPILLSVVAYWLVKSQIPKSVRSQIRSDQIRSDHIRSHQITLRTDLANHLLPGSSRCSADVRAPAHTNKGVPKSVGAFVYTFRLVWLFWCAP